MTHKVRIDYIDKRINKPYFASEVYVPANWSDLEIKEWFINRHKTFAIAESIQIRHLD